MHSIYWRPRFQKRYKHKKRNQKHCRFMEVVIVNNLLTDLTPRQRCLFTKMPYCPAISNGAC